MLNCQFFLELTAKYSLKPRSNTREAMSMGLSPSSEGLLWLPSLHRHFYSGGICFWFKSCQEWCEGLERWWCPQGSGVCLQQESTPSGLCLACIVQRVEVENLEIFWYLLSKVSIWRLLQQQGRKNSPWGREANPWQNPPSAESLSR